MKVFRIIYTVMVILLIVAITGCASAVLDNGKSESTLYKLQKTPYINAKITAPEGFQKGAPVTENTLLEYYKDSAGIILSRSYIGEDDTLDEYVIDSKERFEDDVHSFMEFTFVDTDGLELKSDGRRAIAFEALQNKVLKKFWVVYVQKEDHVFEITCYASKNEFDSFISDFNEAIDSFVILK